MRIYRTYSSLNHILSDEITTFSFEYDVYGNPISKHISGWLTFSIILLILGSLIENNDSHPSNIFSNEVIFDKWEVHHLAEGMHKLGYYQESYAS